MTDQSNPPPEPSQSPGSAEPAGPAGPVARPWQPPPSTWSDPLRRSASFADGLHQPSAPPVWGHPHGKTRKRAFIGIAVAGAIVLGVVVGLLETGASGKDTPAAATSSAGVELALSATPTAATSSTTAIAVPSSAAPVITRAPITTAAPPATKTVHVSAVAPPATPTATASCHPQSIFGACFLIGSSCPSADHGMTGVSVDGQPMRCVAKNDSWLWESA